MSLIDFLKNFDTDCQTDYAKASEGVSKGAAKRHYLGYFTEPLDDF